MKKLFVILTVLCFAFMPTIQAKDINHSHSQIGNDVLLEDNVYGTSMIAGESTETSGNIQGINFMAANNIKFGGQSDYLACAGNSIKIGGKVLNDTFIAGNIVDIKKSAYLERDVMIAASDVEINGSIGRNATIYAAKVVINGANISGNVKIYAEDITIGDDATITGSVSVPKDAKAKISSNVTNIIKTNAIHTEDADVFMQFLVNKVWAFMGLALVFAVLTIFLPNLFSAIQNKYKKVDFNQGIESITKGLVFLIIVPVISVICLLIPFGVSLSLILLVLYILAIYLSKIFAAYLLGYKIWQKYFKSDINILVVGLMGLFILFVLDFIPVIRGLSLMISLLFGIGIITELFNDRKKA